MGSRDLYLRELLIEVARGNVGGQRFNDLLLKSEVFLDDEEWRVPNRLLEASEELDHLASLSTASLH